MILTVDVVDGVLDWLTAISATAAAIATIAAVIVAIRDARAANVRASKAETELEERRRRDEELQRTATARDVYAWGQWEGDPAGSDGHAIPVRVRMTITNRNTFPVFDVAWEPMKPLQVDVFDALEWILSDSLTVVEAGETRTEDITVWVPNPHGVGRRPDIAISFSEVHGTRWRRTPDGEVREIEPLGNVIDRPLTLPGEPPTA